MTKPIIFNRNTLSYVYEYSGLPLPDNVVFDTELVSITISKLKRGKAPGIDGLMAEHLIFSHPILAVILSKLFNLMLSVRCVPREFKFSYIVPIPKPKDYYSKPLKCDDFRGIAISPILSKVFKYCLLEKCNYFLKTPDT